VRAVVDSDDAGAPQDGLAVATDLHALLENAGVSRPIVLVGHSTGGPYVRVFAQQYPDDVAGMVLLDAQPADAFTALPTFPSAYSSIRFDHGPTPVDRAARPVSSDPCDAAVRSAGSIR
jgi:pimeloyl-ACP methyl ester carboxylesterase